MTTVGLKSILSIFVGGIVLAVVPGPSIAADGKISGPTACQLMGNVAGAQISYGVGSVTNTSPSGQAINIVCSMVRDNTTNTNGLSDLQVAVTDPLGILLCDAVSADRSGNPVKIVRRTTPGKGAQVLDWGTSLNVSANRGHYSLNCFVPLNASIHSILANEF